MKKVLGFVLALVMVMALSVTAFAESEIYNGLDKAATKDVDVTAGYTAGSDTKGATTYKFTVSWEASDTSLRYVGKQIEYVWDANDTTKLHYKEDVKNEGAAGWFGKYVLDVTVTNYSNAALSLKTTATATQDLDITNNGEKDQTVANAAVDSSKNEIHYTNTEAKGSQQTATVSYTFAPKTDAGAPTGASGDSIIVGNVNITVDKAA